MSQIKIKIVYVDVPIDDSLNRNKISKYLLDEDWKKTDDPE